MLYSLSKELFGHKGCVRCVCVLKDNRIVTGGLDNQIIIWKFTNDYWNQELHLLHHNKYILALESSDSKSSNEIHNIEFYSGGLDEVIYRLSANDGKIIATYKGHTSAICSIKELSKLNILVSGSWDGSARIWDITSSACKRILNGHQHAVAVSIISQPNYGKYFLLTGSQNKSLHLWEIPEAKLIKTISSSHDDIIRSIGISNNICNDSLVAITVSNDCTIKIWQLNLEPGYENCVLKNTKKYHNSFIFDVKFSKYHNERFFTASDDCNIAIWQLSDSFEITLLQNISLQSTVWNLAEMNNIDSFLSVSEDGVCRIWEACISDNDSNKFSVSKKLDYIEDMNRTGSSKYQNSHEENINLFIEAHDISQLNLIFAEQIGTIQIFKDGDDFKAYEWANNIWNFLGIVTGINDKTRKVKYFGDEYFNSGFYDLVAKVETEIECNYNEIPFNFGDSVLESAEKFCLREGINRKYCQAISISIINNIPMINRNVTSFNQSFEACFEFKLFKTFNIEGLISSFRKEQKAYSNQFCSKAFTNDTNFLLDVEIEYLNDFFLRLKNEVSNEANSITSFRIKSVEMDIIYKKLSNFIGNNSLSVPIIDLWRILAFNPQSSDIHKKSDQGWWLLALVLKVIDLISLDTLENPLTNESNEFRGSLFLICTRFLCNMFHNSTNKEVMLSKIQEIISTIDQSIIRLKERNIQLSSKENTNKNVAIVCLALMFNYIVALNNKNCNVINLRNSIIQFVCKLIPLMTSCDSLMKYVDEILHYQLLILTNNYYHLIKCDNYVDIYIIEDKYIDIISDLLLKHNNIISSSSKTLYYQLVISINLIKNRRN